MKKNYIMPLTEVTYVEVENMLSSSSNGHDNGNHNGFGHSEHHGYDKHSDDDESDDLAWNSIFN